uniref:RDD domain-containing protein n=1 Tax=Globodera rostochiensis TaxID=31243 RepID=A0A914H1V8_GLORO
MDEQPKKLDATKNSPQRLSKRKRVTVAEKLTEKKNCRANNPLGYSRQDVKALTNWSHRGERSQHWSGTKEANDRSSKAKYSGSNQSNSEERRNGERRGGGGDGGGRNCGAIPDRWLQYQIAISQPIGNTRFLAFKTPLGSLFFDASKFKDRQEHRFEVESVIDHVRFLETSLGLVIDLTNTDRYYDCALWSTHEVQYVKIRCPGHERGNDGRLVGVHCTHGLNRTGYLICRYLIEELGWSADNAIEGFRVARGGREAFGTAASQWQTAVCATLVIEFLLVCVSP